MEKGQICEIYIEDMSTEGQGIGKVDGLACFVKGAVLGDRVKAELTKVKKNYAFGRMTEITEPSEDRIEALCPYQEECGGCPLGKLSYEAQLALKEKQVRDKLIRLGGLKDPKVNPIVGMDEPFRYRNKGQFAVSTGGVITKKGGVVVGLEEPSVGFRPAKSHKVVDCQDCLLQSEPAMAVTRAVKQFMIEDNITAFDPKWQRGLMRHVVVKTAMHTGEVMVILVINGRGIPNAEKLVEMLDDAVFNVPVYEGGVEYNLKSVIVNVNKSKDLDGQILGEECITLAGSSTIMDSFSGLDFEISPLAFYQVNTEQMEKLYDIAVKYAALTGNETVLDLYCGVGTIGLLCAKDAKEVIGIETVKGAVLDANRNAVINGIVNARYICGRAEEELPKVLSGENDDIKIKEIDVAILDPPRAGCDEKLLDAVIDGGAKKIVYVSCDPATQARDIKYLTGHGYEFVEATPVDQFGWTSHVECVVLLTKVHK